MPWCSSWCKCLADSSPGKGSAPYRPMLPPTLSHTTRVGGSQRRDLLFFAQVLGPHSHENVMNCDPVRRLGAVTCFCWHLGWFVVSASLFLIRCGWYLSIFCEHTKADVLGCRLRSFLALAAGLCSLLPAASDGCVPYGGVGPPKPNARLFGVIESCNIPRTRMVLNHRIYYQLLKHDLLISFDKSNHASEDCRALPKATPVPSRLVRAELHRGSSLSSAALVLCKCVSTFHHQHLVGPPPEPSVAERAGRFMSPGVSQRGPPRSFPPGEAGRFGEQCAAAWRNFCCVAYAVLVSLTRIGVAAAVVFVKISRAEATASQHTM